jgi:hypothetical protein
MFFKKKNKTEEEIYDKLRTANQNTLQGTNEILAVAILYENPNNIVWPDKGKLAEMIIGQYQKTGLIPRDISMNDNFKVKTRQLVEGIEISQNAGLDTAGSNRILSKMLADIVSTKEAARASAIAFIGYSHTLGQTFFAIMAI